MKNYILLTCTILLTFLFIYTGANKLYEHEIFEHQLNNQVFPRSFTPVLMIVIPGIELLLAVLLFFDRTRKYGFTGSFILMSLFTLYTSLVLLHVFSRVPCSCGGVISQLSWPQHLVFNIVFTGIAYTGLRLHVNHKPPVQIIHA